MADHDYLSGCVLNTGNEEFGDVRNLTIKHAQELAVSAISMKIDCMSIVKTRTNL